MAERHAPGCQQARRNCVGAEDLWGASSQCVGLATGRPASDLGAVVRKCEPARQGSRASFVQMPVLRRPPPLRRGRGQLLAAAERTGGAPGPSRARGRHCRVRGWTGWQAGAHLFMKPANGARRLPESCGHTGGPAAAAACRRAGGSRLQRHFPGAKRGSAHQSFHRGWPLPLRAACSTQLSGQDRLQRPQGFCSLGHLGFAPCPRGTPLTLRRG